ncbi:MAG: division/cell wall cluster transcriptional repressor MraZ [Clostridiales bacterium]|nr:division/cell wall cluster transcriptional repressor MraZ [Clostridiales bacterium]
MDEKGRLFFPNKLREEIGECFYVTKGLDGCLFVYSVEDWAKLEDRLKALPLSKARNLQRFFISGATQCQCDSHGRILIPSNLREYASLEKEICITGVADRAEIWNSDKWRQLSGSITDNPEEIAKVMEELGF